MMKPLLPGATIGMLGGGQLGRMFTLVARRMGYRVHVFDSTPGGPTAQIADQETVGDFEDTTLIEKFARAVDVVTYEFENIPAITAETLENSVSVHPSSKVLFTVQHRLREKTFLAKHGFPIAKFFAIRAADDIEKALAHTGAPAILKTAGYGYDGKGQADVNSAQDVVTAWEENLGRAEAVLEERVHFDSEVSIIVSRNAAGEFADYGLIENEHRHHILHISQAPANLPAALHQQASQIARELCEALEVVGLICIEFFRCGDQLLINEIAPRPHNSGHLTIEACQASQFEGQLRAACGLPPGNTELLRPAAMVNLLGDLWQKGTPDWEKVLLQPNLHLHLYGKAEARPGRKMGHITALSETSQQARSAADEIFHLLSNRQELT